MCLKWGKNATFLQQQKAITTEVLRKMYNMVGTHLHFIRDKKMVDHDSTLTDSHMIFVSLGRFPSWMLTYWTFKELNYHLLIWKISSNSSSLFFFKYSFSFTNRQQITWENESTRLRQKDSTQVKKGQQTLISQMEWLRLIRDSIFWVNESKVRWSGGQITAWCLQRRGCTVISLDWLAVTRSDNWTDDISVISTEAGDARRRAW